jgi:hypothetical protein
MSGADLAAAAVIGYVMGGWAKLGIDVRQPAWNRAPYVGSLGSGLLVFAFWPILVVWLNLPGFNGPGNERARAELIALFGTALSAFPILFLMRLLTSSTVLAYGLTFLLTMVVNWYAQTWFEAFNSASLGQDSTS